ncbi:MAG: ArnT family glycosyltransferase [Thermoanaerobaculia bacterium]
MLVLIPVLVYGLLARALRRGAFGRAAPATPGEALLGAAVVCGLIASFGLELLGAFGLCTRAGVLVLWLVALAAAALLWRRPAEGPPLPGRTRPPLEPDELLLLVGVAAVALLVGLTAWASAPNNWDSLTYHLPRVRHWIQDRSLANYPTSILRQLTLSPGAEVLLVHLRLLAGSDRLWNLLQWAAWIGCVVAASGIAERLGGGRTARIAASVFAATLPLAILQGSSTQNDLVLAFWLLTLVSFLLRALDRDSDWSGALLGGGSLALAVLTKATAYPFALPFLVWFAISLFRRRGLRAAVPLALGAGIVLLANAGQWVRNQALFGSPLGTDYGTVNEARTPAILVSNLARNAALHLFGPSDGWNRSVEGSVAALHRLLGVGVNDPRSTWRGAEFQVPAGLSRAGRPDAEEALFAMFHDGRAGNPIHLLLLVSAGTLVLARKRLRPSPTSGPYLAATAAGALLFCLVLRWQPWNARLQLPLFLLGAPLAGVALSGERRPKWARRGLLLLLLLALPWALVNATRPLLGGSSVLRTPRLEQYFAEIPGSGPALLAAARAAASGGCRRVGLEIAADDPEELLWIALEAAAPGPWRVEHVGVRNRSEALSRRAPFSGFEACAVVSLGRAPGGAGKQVVFSGEWAGGRVTVERRP